MLFSGLFLLKYSGIWKNISENIPDRYNLYQNYPNPFNAGTVIRFQLSVESKITIKVYDVQGREIRTIVNEHLKPGTYESSFDAASLSSGIYFYKLLINGSTLNYADTRKMLLLK